MKIWINEICYTISYAEPLEVSEGRRRIGEIDYATANIYIDNDLDKQVKRVTLMHEILHGILYATGHDDENQDEGLINAVAGGLVAVLRNNHHLVEHLLDT